MYLLLRQLQSACLGGRATHYRQRVDRYDVACMPINFVTVWPDVRRWANSSARRLRTELDYAMEG